MMNLSIAFCQRLAKARRAKAMTQSALAEAVGCKQSAISMLESGQTSKISGESVAKIAALLEVPLPEAEPSVAPAPLPEYGQGFCPNAHCFSNIPYVIADELIFWPRPAAGGAAARHCVVCGELLERRCPHCGAAADGGAACASCGGMRVTNTLPPETDAAAWAAARRREIAEWRDLTLG